VVRRALAFIPIVIASAASIAPGLITVFSRRLLKGRRLARRGSLGAG
jgi:hypothetical protein